MVVGLEVVVPDMVAVREHETVGDGLEVEVGLSEAKGQITVFYLAEGF